MNVESKAISAIQKIQRECPTCIFDSNAAVKMKDIIVEKFQSLQKRIEDLEYTLNYIYHSTDCTTRQIELINEICPQNEPTT